MAFPLLGCRDVSTIAGIAGWLAKLISLVSMYFLLFRRDGQGVTGANQTSSNAVSPKRLVGGGRSFPTETSEISMPLFALRIGRLFSSEAQSSHSRAINSGWRWIVNISGIIMLHNGQIAALQEP
ncbi:hypothetical protein ASPNIDRAFT_38197 [Aspergillus niger ATCC 1015]|uniref:Uncharacterized protein n=1 Tax=Aspergillus niger (strain ATCC 1015 / CBS 113.46 / FGSC A1144 / LSHB Ac4 / NCTC 3858a / NRRL 328 / USDA 3528.7) TaxID=380704 RepID=G3YHK4_ASPNA|nr:hypothetical protein ASPNIDRAFT_38197 [Aspergillus niger ATCC 1015]